MKKILFLLMLAPFLALSQKDEKTKLRYDTITKTLTRERTIVVTEIIDTARINSEIFRLEADAAGLNVRIDSLRAQQKGARKLLKGKKGNGNNRAADTPPTPAVAPTTTKPKATTKPKKDGKN